MKCPLCQDKYNQRVVKHENKPVRITKPSGTNEYGDFIIHCLPCDIVYNSPKEKE